MSRGTRTRQATHAAALLRGTQCPNCQSHNVSEHVIHREPTRLCRSCGHLWKPVAVKETD